MQFTNQDLGCLTKHLGIWYEKQEDADGTYLQGSIEKFWKHLIDDFKNPTETDLKPVKIPAFPGKTLSKYPKKLIHILDEYCSFMGRLLFYVKKIVPECSNAIWELSKYMGHPTEENWRALKCLMAYLKHTNYFTYKLRNLKDLRLVVYVDSNYATNTNNQKSISGGALTMGGQIVHTLFKKQSSMTLSSTEAEDISIATMAQEILFVQTLLKMVAPLEYLTVILKDNTGAIFLAEN